MFKFPCALGATLLLSVPVLAQEKPAATPKAPANALLRPVEVAAASQLTDDQLLSLAGAAGVNILIDASQMPSQAAASPARSGTLYGALNALATERKTTWLKNGENLFLCWSEPDIDALARKVAAEILKPVPAETPLAQVAPVAPAEIGAKETPSLSAQLSAYFASPATWEGGVAGRWKDTPLAILPAPLREEVVAAARQSIVGPQGLASSAVWFSDEFWNRARLRVQPLKTTSLDAERKPVTKTTQWLFLGGEFSGPTGRKGAIWRSIGIVPTAP